jgi:hypothetical protein
LRAGGSLQIFYPLPGAKPAGGYALQVSAVTGAPDPKLHADLLLRSGGSDHTLASLDSTPPPMPGSFHLQTLIQGNFCAQAITPQTGDGLVVRINYVSGSADLSVIETTMTTP